MDLNLNLNLDDFIDNEKSSSENNKENVVILHHSELVAKKQARKIFKQIKELAESILEYGVLQPIIISNEPDENGKYIIIAGERRWKACVLLDIYIPCIKAQDSANYRTIQIIENLQREDLTLIEECNGIKELQIENSYNIKQLSQSIKKDESWVSRRLKIANAEDEFKRLLEKNAIESITMADNLEKIFKIKPKTAVKLAQSGANREEIQKKIKALKNGINTRVKKKKENIKPVAPAIAWLNDMNELIPVTLIGVHKNQQDKLAKVVDSSGTHLIVPFTNLRITGV
jgi:ParB family chromosome partitioning protein